MVSQRRPRAFLLRLTSRSYFFDANEHGSLIQFEGVRPWEIRSSSQVFKHLQQPQALHNNALDAAGRSEDNALEVFEKLKKDCSDDCVSSAIRIERVGSDFSPDHE